MNTRNSSF